jgi:hypothetical protein
MKRKLIVPILSLIGLMSFVVLGSSPDLVETILESAKDNPITRIFTQSKNQSESQKSEVKSSKKVQRPEIVQKRMDEQQNEIPEYILYERVFRLAIEFDSLAKSQEAKGETVTQFRTYFKDEAKLTSQDDEFLLQTAKQYYQETQFVDAQAEVIIEQLRQQHPVGLLSEGELIKPSPELLQLQEQRNKLALLYRDKLKDLLGEANFNEFNSYVKGSFASGVKLMPVPTTQNTDNQEGEK